MASDEGKQLGRNKEIKNKFFKKRKENLKKIKNNSLFEIKKNAHVDEI